ncbi:MAG: dephospho-CoA kinase [Blautia sp.]|nr:dephospho-CoA kinase [Lachnoclostridium sp.]MCM1212166.1 dephospho-CoA kinase [Blautia sp.]
MMQNKKMKTIGITGGVGSGKSKLLAYVKERYCCRVILADDVAHQVKEPGQRCYEALRALLGKEILNPDGWIDKIRMAEKIFTDGQLLAQVNDIVHPAVKEVILQEITNARMEGKLDFVFVEAALLIEGGYEEILDELWYIYADTGVRKDRLRRFRAYSDEKTARIMQEQLAEEEFRRHCQVVIDNSGSFEDACLQIDRKLEEYLCQR